MRGLVREVTAIAAVVLGYFGTRLWGNAFAAWLLGQFQWPEPVCNLVAYSLLFLGITITLNIVGALLSKLLRAIHLGWANRLLGAVFGAGKWVIILLVIIYLIGQADAQWHVMPDSLRESSLLYNPALSFANEIVSRQ